MKACSWKNWNTRRASPAGERSGCRRKCGPLFSSFMKSCPTVRCCWNSRQRKCCSYIRRQASRHLPLFQMSFGILQIFRRLTGVFPGSPSICSVWEETGPIIRAMWKTYFVRTGRRKFICLTSLEFWMVRRKQRQRP